MRNLCRTKTITSRPRCYGGLLGTASITLSVALWAFFTIPWYIWGWGLMQLRQMVSLPCYNIYTWFFCWFQQRGPVAVWPSKLKYNLPCEKKSRALLIFGFFGFLTGLGLGFLLVLYVFAPWLADLSLACNDT